MTKECIEDMREVVLPFVKKRLLETNYEGLGKSDAEEFTRDFNEILDLATKALDQESILGKIRDEIKELDFFYDNSFFSSNIDAMFKCNDVLKIIDKYKTETEK